MRSAEPRTPIRPASTNIVVEAKNDALWIVCPTSVEFDDAIVAQQQPDHPLPTQREASAH